MLRLILNALGTSWARFVKLAAPLWGATGDWIERRFGGTLTGSLDAALVHDFKSDAAAIEDAPISLSAHSALYVVITLFLLAILWSIFGTLDRIVVAQGRIVTTEPLVVMQPFTTSRILKIHVRTGDRVRAGQVLVSFEPAFADADEASLAQRVRTLEAEIDRIEVELLDRDSFEAGPGADPERISQADFFAQRRSQFASELAIRDSRQHQIETQINADRQSIDGLQRQLELARNVADIRRELHAKDAGSELEVMMAEKEEIDFGLRLSEVVARHETLTQQRLEEIAERQSFLDRWNGDLNQRLVAARQEISQAQENLTKAQKLAEFTELRAPIDAVVLELADRSEGSVLREAETLITLVPDDAGLSLEANILSRDVGFISVGDPVRIKLEAYPYQQYGTVDGRLETLSADSLPMTDNDRSTMVFHASVALEQTIGSTVANGIRLRPGLVATAEIKAGERSIFSYVLDPILRTRDEGMREP